MRYRNTDRIHFNTLFAKEKGKDDFTHHCRSKREKATNATPMEPRATSQKLNNSSLVSGD